jgi:hypothetical protein
MPSVYEIKAPNVVVKSEEQLNHSDQPSPAGPPNKPTSLSGSLTQETTLKLQWINNSHGYERGIIIERYYVIPSHNDINDNVVFSVFHIINIPRSQYFIDLTFDPDYKYFYRVKAFNSMGESDYSNIYIWPGLCGEFGCGWYGDGWFGGGQ